MRHKIIFLLMVVFILTAMPSGLLADDGYVVVTTTLYEGLYYIPLRETFEGLAYNVTWQSETRRVEITKENNTVYIDADAPFLLRNGVLEETPVGPLIIKGKMYLGVSALDKIFEAYQVKDQSSVKIHDQLKTLDEALPKLKDQVAYSQLLSFYSQGNKDRFYDVMLEDRSPEILGSPVMSSADFSKTNTQVAGVDEGDIVKVDSNYIYALKDQKLQIMTTKRDDLKILYTVEEKEFWPKQLFITSNQVILIGHEATIAVTPYEDVDKIVIYPPFRQDMLMVKVYDISNLAFEAPKFKRAFGVTGNYLSSRLVDDYLYLVANQYTVTQSPFIPQVTDTSEDLKINTRPIDFKDIYYFPGHDTTTILYTMGIDLNNLTLQGLDVDTYLGGGSTVYADDATLYVTLNGNGGMWWRAWEERTDIYAFSLDKGQINFKANGSVPGYILNQFAMDAYDDHFRIATTSWRSKEDLFENTTRNNLYILNDDLKEVGALENLAPGERIYSTRMIGDQVYMVTYRQVDPFYVIDTASPTDPKVLGYLKIPGYSSYLHPYDANTLIGIGMSTKVLDDRVINEGVKLSLFDVSDFNQPIEKDKIIIGNDKSSTNLSYDHKAFLFDKEKNILAIPVTLVTEVYSTIKNAYIFNFTKDGHLKIRGIISHANLSEGKKSYYDSNDGVTRILYIGNNLYTLSNNWLKLSDFETLEVITTLKR